MTLSLETFERGSRTVVRAVTHSNLVGAGRSTGDDYTGVGPHRFSDLPASARSVWAKSAEPHGHGHGLLAHLLDVAAVAEVILALEPVAFRRMVAKATGLPEASVPRWMAALAGLHDIGKAIPGFQAKWPPGQREDEVAGLSFHPALALRCDQHSRATAALLAPMLERVAGAERLWCQHVVQSVSAHHGYHFSTTQAAQGAPLREPAVWQQARDVLLEAYWAALLNRPGF